MRTLIFESHFWCWFGAIFAFLLLCLGAERLSRGVDEVCSVVALGFGLPPSPFRPRLAILLFYVLSPSDSTPSQLPFPVQHSSALLRHTTSLRTMRTVLDACDIISIASRRGLWHVHGSLCLFSV